MARRHRSRKAKRTRKRRGGSGLVGALRTALLPFLLYKAQKTQQKRVARRKAGKTKRGGKRKGRKSRKRRR
tara:strand:- start:1294 stop:1506 length:213 start_codon:yes stop_codon:yes gene_type:complete